MGDRLARKVGDTTDWLLTLLEDGAAFDLTLATTIEIYTREQGGAVNKIDGATATVEGAATDGVVRFSPTASQMNAAGEFDGMVKVTLSTGQVGWFPDEGAFELRVEAAFA